MYIYIYIYAYFAHLCTTSYHIYSHTHAKEITKNYHACVKYIYVCTYVHVYLHVYECRYIYSSHPCIVPYSIYSECRRDRTYSITPTLQHTYSIHCNTLQHTSTHCNTYILSHLRSDAQSFLRFQTYTARVEFVHQVFHLHSQKPFC